MAQIEGCLQELGSEERVGVRKFFKDPEPLGLVCLQDHWRWPALSVPHAV